MTIHTGGGYAVRRANSCLENEYSRHSWRPRYYACCPKPMDPTLNPDDNNNYYCSGPEASNSYVPKVCANDTWTLYYNTGFLCCDKGQTAYLSVQDNNDVSDATFGCDTSQYVSEIQRNHSEGTIEILSPYTSPHQNTGLSKGAIAGAVVGSTCGALIIAAVIWYLLRGRRYSKMSNIPDRLPSTEPAAPTVSDIGSKGSEVEPSEIGGDNKARSELYDPAPMRSELEADKRARQELDSYSTQNTRQYPPSELP